MTPPLAILVLLAALGLSLGGGKAAPPDVIRTGGPSAPGDAKVAVVGSSRDLTGERYEILGGGGSVVLTGKLAPADGSPAPWRRAFVADLSAVRKAGAYRVRAAGIVSRPWVVAPHAVRATIRTLLRFFAVNSDGREPSPIHGPSHLHDALLGGRPVDLTGGWMDAGDMIKFVQTTGYTAAMLQAAARLEPALAAELNRAADVGIRWLLKAHVAEGVFVAQIGDERDHDLGWRRPDRDDRSAMPGIGTRIAYPGISGDLGGKAAAALALAADRAGGARRALLLREARAWYSAAKRSARPTPVLPVRGYESSTWRDDLAAGAAALYRTTGEAGYAVDARRYLAASRDATWLHWSSFAAFAAADLCGALGAPPAGDPAARAAGCRALALSAQDAAGQAGTTAFGTPGVFTWGQTAEQSSAGGVAALAERAGLGSGGLAVAAGARDYLLGRNPWGASFVVGYGLDPARHPHHWAEAYAPGEPVGAVVGGPAERATLRGQGFDAHGIFDTSAAAYEDRAADYVTSEPALDYTVAAIVLLAALDR